MPDVVATANKQQLQSSPNHVVFVLAALGELDHKNENNKVEKNDDSDPTTNVTLHVHASKRDLHLWDVMDKVCLASFLLFIFIISPSHFPSPLLFYSYNEGMFRFAGSPAHQTSSKERRKRDRGSGGILARGSGKAIKSIKRRMDKSETK